MSFLTQKFTDAAATDWLFDEMSGTLAGRRTVVEAIARPGLDDVAYRLRGQKAPVSTITTKRYFLTRALALAGRDAYYTLIGDDPITITMNGESMGSHVVEGGEMVGNVIAVTNVLNALTSNSQALLVFRWQVRRVATS